MNILLLRGFNNYFNRKVKKYSTLADYRTNSNAYMEFDNINFNPNDGVVTELIVGNENQKENSSPLDWENIGTPDYCICFDMVEDSPVIRSRWYVLESVRTRSGQYRIALKRDSIVDHINAILNANIFVEKGMIQNESDPLIFNRESMTYNQIKDREILLKDSTKSAWIVGYVAKNSPAKTVPVPVDIDPNQAIDGSELDWLPAAIASGSATLNNITGLRAQYYAAASRSNLTSSDYYDKLNIYYEYFQSDTSINTRMTSNHLMGPLIGDYIGLASINTGIWSGTNFAQKYLDTEKWTYGNEPYSSISNLMTILMKSSLDRLVTEAQRLMSFSGVTNISQYVGKIIKYNNKFYKIALNGETVSKERGSRLSNITQSYPYLYQQFIKQIQYNRGEGSSFFPEGSWWRNYGHGSIFNLTSSALNNNIFIEYDEIPVTVTEVASDEASLSFPDKTGRIQTNDAVYDMFAIPYNDNIAFKESSSGPLISNNTIDAMATARAISMELTSSAIYDVQILPYCPLEGIRNIIETESNKQVIDLSLLTANQFDNVTSNGSIKTVVFWCNSVSGTIDIDTTIDYYDSGLDQVSNKKIANETEVCRLVSPNYSGMFEFSLAKNNGCNGFNVDYTYKPYNPYIHVNPMFSGIYGRDWDDARGLICGGNFSVATVDSAWQQYQLNNKNYAEIFDRQIQNMDVNNAIAMERQELSAALGTAQGALGGLVGGAMAGAAAGPWGALAGAIVGGIGGGFASGIAGQKDTEFLDRSQKENRSYAIDMYGYQLGNIKALPYSLARTDALTYNNKLFPFIEIYECTQEERDALIEKIKYDGMTIMKVANATAFLSNSGYFKGRLIRIEGIDDDMHIADDIYNELNKGIYIPEGGLS